MGSVTTTLNVEKEAVPYPSSFHPIMVPAMTEPATRKSAEIVKQEGDLMDPKTRNRVTIQLAGRE